MVGYSGRGDQGAEAWLGTQGADLGGLVLSWLLGGVWSAKASLGT